MWGPTCTPNIATLIIPGTSLPHSLWSQTIRKRHSPLGACVWCPWNSVSPDRDPELWAAGVPLWPAEGVHLTSPAPAPAGWWSHRSCSCSRCACASRSPARTPCACDTSPPAAAALACAGRFLSVFPQVCPAEETKVGKGLMVYLHKTPNICWHWSSDLLPEGEKGHGVWYSLTHPPIPSFSLGHLAS